MAPPLGSRRHLVGGAVLISLGCSLLLVHSRSGEPGSWPVPWTYRDLLRGPLVLAADEPAVVSIVRAMLDGPSAEPYRLRRPGAADSSQLEQLASLTHIVGRKTGGTFVEAGAFDGETHSTTLFLERFMDWTGLLVEAENWSYRQLLLTHRKARTLNACLAPAAHPQQLGFEGMPGSPLSYVEPGSAEAQLDRQRRPRRCFPLYSVLLAAGLTTVDLLALDVEGIEYLVLHSLPWHLVDIKVVMVDYVKPDFQFENGSYDPILEEPIRKLMADNSYHLVHRLDTDLIFVKSGSEYDTTVHT
ncbi:protein Star-like isoform X1 [Amphibalanus amphitrite]|uniref:protein Star-like isoform X1 n=1 Tax=Amphibalanus amphitrite TaxID=1232801 RepID=UPI001C921B82|nr:protein Star-like isoform X1 [Amphibalanus amphitrite]XP_043228280.1 protein Star-like isoform X1 [Amphibalanus amphitrite]XP_043228281.1 protein Star-like isoform X1 [Amphibalanus amphitrite]XP_043228282.1 protein Star-like isoform X1 [Amphibalanus amphitrite]XP_043228283.1 protein Star-like isoform X1 [Amphibalanus amphitrite]